MSFGLCTHAALALTWETNWLLSGPDVVVHALPTATAMEVVPRVAEEHCHGSEHYLAPARHHPHPILEDVGNSAVAGGNWREATIGAVCVCVCGEEVEVNEEWRMGGERRRERRKERKENRRGERGRRGGGKRERGREGEEERRLGDGGMERIYPCTFHNHH